MIYYPRSESDWCKLVQVTKAIRVSKLHGKCLLSSVCVRFCAQYCPTSIFTFWLPTAGQGLKEGVCQGGPTLSAPVALPSKNVDLAHVVAGRVNTTSSLPSLTQVLRLNHPFESHCRHSGGLSLPLYFLILTHKSSGIQQWTHGGCAVNQSTANFLIPYWQ